MQHASSSFFDPSGGGDPAMFQHVLWYFGHPEVWAVLIPIIIGCVLGVLIFLRGRLKPDIVSILCVLTGVGQAIFGALIAQRMYAQGMEMAVHDAYYITYHMRMVMWLLVFYVGSAVVYFFFRSIVGVNYRRWLGVLHWAVFTLGTALILAPAHYLSTQTLPRRFVDYQDTAAGMDALTSAGVFATMLSFVVFAICIGEAIYRRVRHGKDLPRRDVPIAEEFS